MLWGVSLATIGVTAAPALAPLLMIIGGAGLTIVDIAGRTILQRSIRDEVLARVFGIQESLAMAGLAVGAILASAVAEVAGLEGAMAVAAALLPVAVIVTWPRLAALDRRALVPVQALALLRRTRLFSPLPPPQLEAVARRGLWLTVPADTAVIREGDPGDRYYIVSTGTVSVEQGGVHLRDLGTPGTGFGEIALIRDVPRTATVTTMEETVLFAIDRAPFLAAVTGHPDAFRAADASAAEAVGRS
jgi:hypothetical protein